MSESQVIQLIKEKKLSANAFWLKHNSLRYGARALPQASLAQMPELTVGEEQLFRKALALSSSIKNNNHGKHKPKKAA